jgi:predicted ATP-dependent serine protease
MTALASDAGIGKTLLALTLARTMWAGGRWPDGQENPLPAGTRTLWVPGDQHYHQLMDVARAYGLPDEAILLNRPADEPIGDLDLDDPAAVAALAGRIEADAPGLVIVDTVGQVTARNLGRPEEARQFFQPLMTVAARTGTGFLMLTHLSREGDPLGRRIIAACRVVWKLSQPDKEGQPDRRKLWVDKSQTLKPPPLGMTIAAEGCSFDFEPPQEPAKDKGGRPATRLGPCTA